MPSMLESFIPRPHVRERDRVAVVADVSRTWEAMRHLDASQSRFVRALFALRHLPDLGSGRLTDVTPSVAARPTFKDVRRRPGHDFQLLEERAQRGFVVGAIARFGEPQAKARPVRPRDFAAFHEPGYAKIAWGLSVVPRRSGGSWVTFELRVSLTDPASEAAFDRAWKLISPFTHAIRTVVLGLLEKQLDAIDPEHTALPGDLLMPARSTRTMGVVVEATPLEVWPWLLQLGSGRAGWYALDAAPTGAPRPDDVIHPEWQHLEVGALVGPREGSDSPLAVLELDPGRALVLGSPSLRAPRHPPRSLEPDFKVTWAFVLEPIGDEACWLGARVRADTAFGLELALRQGWDVLGHQVLQRTLLQNIKARVERRHLAS